MRETCGWSLWTFLIFSSGWVLGSPLRGAPSFHSCSSPLRRFSSSLVQWRQFPLVLARTCCSSSAGSCIVAHLYRSLSSCCCRRRTDPFLCVACKGNYWSWWPLPSWRVGRLVILLSQFCLSRCPWALSSISLWELHCPNWWPHSVVWSTLCNPLRIMSA